MTDTPPLSRPPGRPLGRRAVRPQAGLWWFLLALVGAGLFFRDGLVTLAQAWALPEYSHGPLIPVLSGILFLRQLKDHPARPGPVADRGPGLALLILALALGAGGSLIGIGDIVAYALILWVGSMLLIGFGWRQGRVFWPPVLHLIYMLPLPGVLYYGLSTFLQGLSSELGVWFLRLMSVPVFLDGNIIDLGVLRLHVAEACSGLRYLFPILSFSYIFAVLYRGPVWHKAVLLISAVPITVVMNSVRIALAGAIVDRWGPAHLEGFSHFFEGWVIFLACVAILFALAWVLLFLRRDRQNLAAALDVDLTGLAPQARRILDIAPSRILTLAAVLSLGLAALMALIPARMPIEVARDPFALFPATLGGWRVDPARTLEPDVARILAADDYLSTTISRAGDAQPVDLFIAWYRDQRSGGTHTPEVCLPGAGWEIAGLGQITATDPGGKRFTLNRAVIQKGAARMLVYYWFEQQGTRTASGFSARLQLTLGKITNGRGDSAMVRLITPIAPARDGVARDGVARDGVARDGTARDGTAGPRARDTERDLQAAEIRLQAALSATLVPLPRFIPGL
jgi:exosortase D (VPLPA-CTERM-specific)